MPKSFFDPLLAFLSKFHIFLNYVYLNTDTCFNTPGEGAKWAISELLLKSNFTVSNF